MYVPNPWPALFAYMDAKEPPMTHLSKLLRLGFAITALGMLGACTVVPVQPGGYYRAAPAYVETYPAYGYPGGSIYYESRPRYYDDRRDDRYYREDRRYREPRRYDSPLESAARTHRDIRRSLGLPRLPGMP